MTETVITLGVTALKARSLGLIDRIAHGTADRIVLTRRGKPVAAVVPIEADELPPLYGCMRGMVGFVDGVDLTEPTGEIWDAQATEGPERVG